MVVALTKRENRRGYSGLYQFDANQYRQNLGRATRFDGSSIIGIGSSLGPLAGKEGTISMWFRPEVFGSRQVLLGNSGARFEVSLESNGTMSVNGNTSPSGTNVLSLTTTVDLGDVNNIGKWHHLMASWNLDTLPVGHVYIDNVDDGTLAVGIDDTVDYARVDWSIGGGTNSFSNYTGCIAEIWFSDAYIDLSDANNRTRFVNPHTLGRVFAGENGEWPLTGAGVSDTPWIYLTGAPDTTRKNIGQGADFNTNIEGQPIISDWSPIRLGV